MASALYNPIDRTYPDTPNAGGMTHIAKGDPMPMIVWNRPEVGSIVYLKSGSPPMTVNSIRSGSQVGRQFVSVEWFNGPEIKRDMFDPECLTTEKPAA